MRELKLLQAAWRRGQHLKAPVCAMLGMAALASTACLNSESSVRLEFVSSRPNEFNSSLYVYLKNDGLKEERVERIKVNGVQIEEFEAVSWHRIRPGTIGPGSTSEILVRFHGLPQGINLAVKMSSGQLIERDISISRKREPVQINFIGFSSDLRTVFVYLQNNRWMLAGEKIRYHIERVFVNGEDVTNGANLAADSLEGTVIPLEVSLGSPLARGEPAVVTVATAEGANAGLTLRAFPSEFPIQTCFFNHIHQDPVREIWKNCFTAASLRFEHYLLDAKALGIDSFPFDGKLERLKAKWRPEYPEIKGLWLDEVNRLPVTEALDIISKAEDFYRPQGKRIPPFTLNITTPSSPSGLNYLEIGDAVTHGYGMDGGTLGGENFAGYASLENREYRLSRRPFWPYFRNAEYGVEIEPPPSNKVIGETRIRPYPMHPKEQRWLIYGTVMQGAKGSLHWGFGLWKRSPPDWMSANRHSLRISQGALPADTAYGYRIPAHIVEDLRAVWLETGRVNAELQTIGQLVARSDVTNLVRIIKAEPENGSGFLDERSAEAASLISGKDTILIIILNMNLATNWTHGPRAREDRAASYPPVKVTVEVQVPPWMKAGEIFTVDYMGIERVEAFERPEEGIIELHFPRVEISKVVVITQDGAIRGKMEETLGRMQERLGIHAGDPGGF